MAGSPSTYFTRRLVYNEGLEWMGVAKGLPKIIMHKAPYFLKLRRNYYALRCDAQKKMFPRVFVKGHISKNR